MRLDPVRGLETEKRPDPCPAASPSLRFGLFPAVFFGILLGRKPEMLAEAFGKIGV